MFKNNPLLFNLTYIIGVGLNIVILRYFSLHIEALNNNGIRFTVGGILLLGWSWLSYQHFLRKLTRTPKLMLYVLSLGMMMATNMYFYLKGVALTSAVTASIFGILAMPFAVIIAAFFFLDERRRIQNAHFWVGSLLAIVGSLVFVSYGKTFGTGENLWLGGVFLFLSIVIQGTQSLIIKAINHQLNAITISAFTSFSAGIFSLFLSHQTGTLAEISSLSAFFLTSLVLMGIFAIVAGMVLGFHIIQTQGIITYQILQLLLPLSTAIIGYFALNETLSSVQLGAGIIVIVGASLALKLLKIWGRPR